MAFTEHPSRASRLRDGEYVVLDDALREDCTVWFSFGRDSDGESEWEGLLTRRLGPDRARICAVPLFVYDVNLGDEVSLVEYDEGAPVATGLVRDAGNFTFRVRFADAGAEDAPRWKQLLRDLEPFDCWFDIYSRRFLALSATPEEVEEVAAYLRRAADAGHLEYETGRT